MNKGSTQMSPISEANSHSKAALSWIVAIFKKHNIPFQISGGLAAIAYGAVRPLADIDIDIPDAAFDLIMADVNDYIIYGPARYKSEKWDLLLMTLNYHGQEIDIGGADETRIFNEKTHQWQKLTDDFSKVEMKEIFGLQLPVIPYENLVAYKKILAREVDLIDLKEIEKK